MSRAQNRERKLKCLLIIIDEHAIFLALSAFGDPSMFNFLKSMIYLSFSSKTTDTVFLLKQLIL